MNSYVTQAHRITLPAQAALTRREVQVLDLIARGLDYREVAGELEISIDTVKTHIKKIYLKLDAKNAPHAVSIAIARKLITTEKKKS